MRAMSTTIATLVSALIAGPGFAQEAVRLTQDQAVERAMAASHRLAEAAARQTAAEAAVRTRQTADKPTVGVSAGYGRTNHVDQFGILQPNGTLRLIYPDIPDNYFTRATFQWPIYTAGRTGALERAAEAEARATSEEFRAARADLRLEVVRAYWALVTASEAERVVQEAVDRAEAHLRNVRAHFDAGMIPPNDVSAAETQRSRQRLQLIESQNLRRGALEELRRLTGIAGVIETADGLDADNPRTADDLPTAPATRPEHQAIVQRITAAEERRRAVNAGGRPTVAVSGAADYANPNPRIFPRRDVWRDSWELTIAATWTLWDGGRLAAEAAEATAAEAVLRARLAEVDSLLTLEITQRRLDAESARAALATALEGVRSAADARRVVAERFAVGVATSTEVLDAQVALLQAELDRTRALANIRLADARLDRALGRVTWPPSR